MVISPRLYVIGTQSIYGCLAKSIYLKIIGYCEISILVRVKGDFCQYSEILGHYLERVRKSETFCIKYIVLILYDMVTQSIHGCFAKSI